MSIIKSVMYGDFEDPRLRDRNLGTLKLKKMPFWPRKFINLLITIKWLNVEGEI